MDWLIIAAVVVVLGAVEAHYMKKRPERREVMQRSVAASEQLAKDAERGRLKRRRKEAARDLERGLEVRLETPGQPGHVAVPRQPPAGGHLS